MGVGDSWGTREELLHPRDSNGRFRNTWKMAAGTVDKILSTLASFNPKTFTSDEEAATYVHSRARANRHLSNRGPAIERFLRDYSKINADLEAGKPNADATAIKKGMSPLPDDLMLTRNLTPQQLGLDPANIAQTEELTGKLVSSKGFSSTNVGTPLQHQPGTITMAIAAPKGTKAVIPSTSRPTREVILDTDQPYRITKVDPDGQGGFYVYAVASGDSENEAPVDLSKAVPGAGVQEQTPEVPQGPQTGAEVPQTGFGKRQGRPPGPGPGERNEGHVGIVGQGPGGEQVDTGGETQAPEVPEIPETPEAGEDARNTFREAFENSDVKVPSAGTRRKEFNDAYLGVASGKKTPQEAVNDLDNKIAVHKRTIASDKEDGTDSGPLPEDVKRMEQLSDLIKEHFNFTGRKDFKGPEEKKTPEKKAPKKIVSGKKTLTTRTTTADEDRKRAQKLLSEASGSDTALNRRKRLEAERLIAEADRKDKSEKSGNLGKDLKEIDAKIGQQKKVAKKAVAKKAVAKKAASGKRELGAAGLDTMTIPELREVARENDKKIPSSIRRRADIIAFLKGEPTERDKQFKKDTDVIRDFKKDEGPKTPVKKTPERLTQHMAVGKTNANRVQVGERILVTKDANGDWVSAKNKTGATTITVTRKDAVKMRARQGVQVHGVDDDGNEISVRPGPSIQTFWKAPDKGSVAKKTTPKKPETKAPEVPETPKTDQKPAWGTIKSLGIKRGDTVTYYGSDRRKQRPDGKRVRIEVENTFIQMYDAETGAKFGGFGAAHRGWFGPDTNAPKAPETKGPVKKVTPDAEATVRAVYSDLVKREGGWVPLADVRDRMDAAGITRKDQDAIFIKMATKPGVHLIPWDNLKALTQRDRDASINIGGSGVHALRIEKTVPETKAPEAPKKPAEKGLIFKTVAELRQQAKDEDLTIPTSLRKKADIVDWLAEALTNKEHGEPPPKVPLTERQKELLDRKQAREKDAEDRRIAKESRMRLAGERREQRAKEIEARKRQREEEAKEKAAQREQERLRKEQERVELREKKRREREAQKEADRKRREEEKRLHELETDNDYDTLTGPGWTVTMLRSHAESQGITIPNNLRFRSEIRAWIINERIRLRSNRIADKRNGDELRKEAKAEGMILPLGAYSWSAFETAQWMEQQRQTLADLGINPKKFRLQADPTHAGMQLGSNTTPESWDRLLPRNTDPNRPYRIRDWEIESGYKIKYGVAVRRDGIVYLVETDLAGQASNPYETARIIKQLEEVHQSLPEATKFQYDYRWLRKANPDDKTWEVVHNIKGFESAATAGNGHVNVWNNKNRSGRTPLSAKETLRHEYGHNVDQYNGRRLTGSTSAYLSEQQAWGDAAVDDNMVALKRFPDGKGFQFNSRSNNHEVELKMEMDRKWPMGVTTYGKASRVEDFAESTAMYLGSLPIGWELGPVQMSGAIPVREARKEVYFRDLFPNRAKILDQLFPEVAKRQKQGIFTLPEA